MDFLTLSLTALVCNEWLRGIKRVQGSASSARLPITDSIMLVIFNALDLSLPDHRMFWAACTLAYFGFLQASEFTVPVANSFSPSDHLTLQDIALDSLSSPETLRVQIKVSKTDPFRKETFIHIGLGKFPLCAIRAVVSYLSVRGIALAPFSGFSQATSVSSTPDLLALPNCGFSWFARELFQP